jgi:dipeptidyl aminopeptidase/acylaminoacyl peptidase
MMLLRVAAQICAASAILCAGPAAASTAPTPSVDVFAELPLHAPQISPDGSRFALIRGINGRPSVAIYKVDTPSELPQIVTSADWIIADIRWVKNDVLMMYNKKNMKLGVYDRDQQDMLRPLGDAAAILLRDNRFVELTAYADITDVALDDPNTIYVVSQNSVYTMDVRTGGAPKPIYKKYPGPAREGTERWFLDGHGKALARVDTIKDQKSFDSPLWHNTLKVLENGSWRALGTYDKTVDVGDGVAGISEDGKSIYRLAPDSRGTVSLNRIDIATGSESKLFQDPTYDVGGTLENEWTGRVVGYVVDEDMPVYHYFDPQREALQKGLEEAFRGLSVHAVSTDLAGDKMIIETVGPRTPPSYYLFDRNTHRATAIAAGYPELDTAALGEVKSYGYSARDGLHIPAYLTLPPGRDPRNLPLVVMPHGGPDARDDMRFDFFSQFLAIRGYAVLQPQFRGSRGFGRPFTVAGLHQWGLKMQDDISDGVKKAVSDGIADPKRVCIFGASYGGYAALAGATLTPQLYACVVSFEGVSDLPDMMGYEKREFNVDTTNGSFTTTRMGDMFLDSAQLDATSPALHADRVSAPVLLLHSELDVTVPIEQSEMMEAALKKAGKKVQFVRIPGDDHYMSLEATRSRVLQEVETFLASSIGT